MRLVCPNCGAQYEVPAEAIPPAGRDVQCSACGHTWFEPGTDGAGTADEAAELAWEDPEDVPRVDDDEEAQDDLAALDWEGEAPAAPPPGAPAAEAPPAEPPRVRSTVTPEVAEILRAEAEREARVRAGEPVAPPVLPAADLGAPDDDELDGALPEAAPERAPDPLLADAYDASGARGATPDRQRAEEARRRMARLRGDAAPLTSAPVAPATAPARRDRLPDIEELNTSLRDVPSVAEAGPAPVAPPAERGFRLGFGGVLLVAGLLALLYAYAPRITAAVPALAPVLDPYAAAIDGGRLWVDQRLRGLVEAMGGTPSPGPTSSAPASEAPEAQVEVPAAQAPAVPAPEAGSDATGSGAAETGRTDAGG